MGWLYYTSNEYKRRDSKMQQVSKRWDKGVWVLMGICFMMGRAFVGTVNPFGVAMMSVACRERKNMAGWAVWF